MIPKIQQIAKLVSYILYVALIALQPTYGGREWYVALLAVTGAVSVYLARNTPPAPPGP